MSSTDAARESEGAESTAERSEAGLLSSLPLPKSPFFYVALVVGAALFLLGRFVVDGESSGLLGIWGMSLVGAAVLVYLAYGLWSVLG